MNRQRLAGALLLLLLAAPVVLADPGPAADLQSEEPLGYARFNDATGDRGVATIFASPAALRHADQVALVFVPGIPDPLTQGEVRALEDQRERGAWLWVLDETGHANALTAADGIEVRPDEVLDPNAPLGPRFVRADATWDNRTYELVLSAPTLLDLGEEAQAVAHTRAAFRDLDRSGEIGPDDTAGTHPVVALSSDGRLLVASETALFTNTALDAPAYENEAFLRALLSHAPEGTVVADASRHDASRWMAPLKVATNGVLAAATDPLSATLLAAALAGAGWWLARRAPSANGWATHEHDLAQVRPLATEQADERYRRLLVQVLAEHTGRGPSELLAQEDHELETLSREVLPGEALTSTRSLEARFKQLRSLLGGNVP